MQEEFKDIPGYEDIYQVSSNGNVKSLCRRLSKILLTKKTNNGYLSVTLYGGRNSKKSASVHRLVAIAFIPNPESKPYINHKDGDKTNNCVENLEWVTASENNKHAYRSGLNSNKGERHPGAKFNDTDIINIRSMYASKEYTQKGLAILFNSDQRNISDIINYKKWKHI